MNYVFISTHNRSTPLRQNLLASFVPTKDAHSIAQLEFFHLACSALHCGLRKAFEIVYEDSQKTHRKATIYRPSVKVRKYVIQTINLRISPSLHRRQRKNQSGTTNTQFFFLALLNEQYHCFAPLTHLTSMILLPTNDKTLTDFAQISFF